MAKLTYNRKCGKCGGSGEYHSPMRGINHGVCFSCGGDGFIAGLTAAAKAMATELDIAECGDLILVGHKTTAALARVISITPGVAPAVCNCDYFCECGMAHEWEIVVAELTAGGQQVTERRRRADMSSVATTWAPEAADDEDGYFVECTEAEMVAWVEARRERAATLRFEAETRKRIKLAEQMPADDDYAEPDRHMAAAFESDPSWLILPCGNCGTCSDCYFAECKDLEEVAA